MKLEVCFIFVIFEMKILKVKVRCFVFFGYGLNFLSFLFKGDWNFGVKGIL